MFSFLVALTLYLTFSSAYPHFSVVDYAQASLQEAFLPIAREAQAVVGPALPSEPEVRRPYKEDKSRLGVDVNAKAAIAIDWETGEILYGKFVDEVRPIASITKLMTALLVLRHGPDWEQVVTIEESDMRAGGIPYVIPGERIKVKDLFNVSLVASGNGATVALARSTGMELDEFVSRMNELTAELGMYGAEFTDPTGLRPGNVASARGVALMLREALSHEEIADTVTTQTYSFRAESGLDHVVRNTNGLLRSFLSEPPYSFLGGKTGFIAESGYCFSAAAANDDGDRVLAVALGAPSKEDRLSDVKNMLYWVFDAYSWK